MDKPVIQFTLQNPRSILFLQVQPAEALLRQLTCILRMAMALGARPDMILLL